MTIHVFCFRIHGLPVLFIIYDVHKYNHIGILRLYLKEGAKFKRLTINSAYILYNTYLHDGTCNSVQEAIRKISKIHEDNDIRDFLWQYTISAPNFKMS